MTDVIPGAHPVSEEDPNPRPGGVRSRGLTPRWRLLIGDRMATVSAVSLLGILGTGLFGPLLVGDLATAQHLDRTGLPPSFAHGWQFLLGSDQLGRSVLARLVVAAQTSLSIAVPAVLISSVIGSIWGMWAGYHRGWRESISMRIADVVLSFPSLLIAVVILYIFDPSIANLIVVLAIARFPVYLRTARAEAAELQSRVFVDAARTFGLSSGTIIRRHVLPIVLPTLLTLATLDFCLVMLMESSLSFLGIGIQPPDISWGLLVAQGRQFLQSQWWISFFPGLAIVVTTTSAAVLAAWSRIAFDPNQRWRLLTDGSRRRKPKGASK
jgi:peptide/nickel transport system permease protein